MNLFERQLTLWVGLCIVAGIALGKVAPDLARDLDAMAIYVNGAPVDVPSQRLSTHREHGLAGGTFEHGDNRGQDAMCWRPSAKTGRTLHVLDHYR